MENQESIEERDAANEVDADIDAGTVQQEEVDSQDESFDKAVEEDVEEADGMVKDRNSKEEESLVDSKETDKEIVKGGHEAAANEDHDKEGTNAQGETEENASTEVPPRNLPLEKSDSYLPPDRSVPSVAASAHGNDSNEDDTPQGETSSSDDFDARLQAKLSENNVTSSRDESLDSTEKDEDERAAEEQFFRSDIPIVHANAVLAEEEAAASQQQGAANGPAVAPSQPAQAVVIDEETPFPGELEAGGNKSMTRNKLVCGAILIAIVFGVLGIVLGVFLSSRNDDRKPAQNNPPEEVTTAKPSTDEPTLGPSSIPTASPTQSPRSIIVEALQPFDIFISKDERTLSFKALRWMLNNEIPGAVDIRDANSQIIVEQYVVAKLYVLTGSISLDAISLVFTPSGTIEELLLLPDVFVQDEYFPSEIGLFQDLKSLVTFTYFSEYPTEIGQLNTLQDLSIRGGNSMPSELGQIQTLRQLTIDANRGPLFTEIGRLLNLEDLRLFRLNGDLPTTIGNLGNLKVLEVELDGALSFVPSEIGMMEALEILRISGLEDFTITGPRPTIPVEIAGLTNLASLELTSLALGSGSFIAELGRLVGLTMLDLSRNQLSGMLPTDIGQLSNLRELFLYDNFFSGQLPPSLSAATHLTQLRIHDNRFSGQIPPEYSNLTELQLIEAYDNSFTGDLDAVFCGFSTAVPRQFAFDCRRENLNCTCCSCLT